MFAPGPSDITRWMCQKCACVFPTIDLSEVCQHVLIIRDRFPVPVTRFLYIFFIPGKFSESFALIKNLSQQEETSPPCMAEYGPQP
jgi:hypothetical protein